MNSFDQRLSRLEQFKTKEDKEKDNIPLRSPSVRKTNK